MAFDRLRAERPTVDARMKKCLGHCRSCREVPIATVDGHKVKGKSGEELYERIIEALAAGSAAASEEDRKKKKKRR